MSTQPCDDYNMIVVMPYGKHQGEPVSELSLGYLGYVYEGVGMSRALTSAIEREIARRIGRDPQYRNPFAIVEEFTREQRHAR